MAGANSENAKPLEALVDGYRKQLFPGTGKPKDDFVETAKKHLAEEAQKVYTLRTHGQMTRETIQNALRSADPNLRSWALKEERQEQIAQARLRQRLTRGRVARTADAETKK